ncbi:hypothetical protein C7S18_17570 [Ahniella affigens]|uniref:DUF2059 domain-containing protein n=1 Tax=Ahniella affigens TaxID=2021234 RepID=A0A2P1PVS1_9GAMM|nr:hypothetical protein [Ahniella affigens]AVP98874.1 hypothetical protein C7S18_17570 [Ahniella affigens]
MRLTLKPLAFVALSCLALTACKDEESAGVGSAKSGVKVAESPLAAVDANIEALKNNDLKALVLSSVPPSMTEHLRAKWKSEMNQDPITEEDRAKFAEALTMLTAPGAEQKIWTDVQPKFAEWQKEAQFQMPMYIGIGQGMLGSMVDGNEDLTEAQKTQAKAGIGAFGTWASSAKFLDADLAQKSIGIVCHAAREMKLESLDQARAMPFDEALEKGNIAFKATRDLLDNYGFPTNDVLKSLKSEVIAQNGDTAKVKVTYQMFGTPLEVESDLVKLEGGWYSKESVEKIRAEMNGSANSEPSPDADAAEGSDESAEG